MTDTTSPRTGTASPMSGAHAGTAVRAAFLLAAPLFVFYPAARPFSSEIGLDGAAAWASPWWMAAHLAAVLGFVLLFLGTVELLRTIPARRGLKAAIVGLFAVALALVVPYYGVEIFGLRTIASAALGGEPSLTSLATDLRGGPQEILFGVGLLALALAGTGLVLAVLGTRGSGSVPGHRRWLLPVGSVLLAAGLVFFLPQFWLDQPGRVAHGVIMAAGCALIGLAPLARHAAAVQPAH